MKSKTNIKKFIPYTLEDISLYKRIIDDILIYKQERILGREKELNLKIKLLNDTMTKYSNTFGKSIENSISRMNDARNITTQKVYSEGENED